MANRIIMGIHGLANKPEAQLLESWWKQSIQEGLANIGEGGTEFDFEMVFWADRLYAKPQHRMPHYEFDPLYNHQPYREADTIHEYKDSWRDAIRDRITEPIATFAEGIGLSKIGDILLKRKLKDLDFYYRNKPIARRDTPDQAIGCRDELKSIVAQRIREHAENDQRILLIAHSMGTIITYDVLRELGPHGGHNPNPLQAPIHWLTIGSPLGVFYVKENIQHEYNYDDETEYTRTPTVVTQWQNFADRRDRVAIDPRLGDEYSANANGVRVIDDLVYNDYQYPEYDEDGKLKSNAHKSYGYLRCPEVSRAILEFLTG